MMTLTPAEKQEILRLLHDGLNPGEIALRTGRSMWSVGRIREDHGLAPGSRARPRSPAPALEEPDEIEPADSSPRAPSQGYGLNVERPNQQRWLAIVDQTTDRDERARLRTAIRTVLGLTRYASDDSIALALVADRRTAEELAGLYLAAIGKATP